MSKELSDLEIEIVKKQAREKIGECRKDNDIIGTQIFSILSLYARVIYYPLGKNAPWGFTRLDGSSEKNINKKPYVAINSSIPVDYQVFAAAHELYHICYDHNPSILRSNLLDEKDNQVNEKKANRFAAEFLVDELLLKKEIELYKYEKINIKIILKLAELFAVPYRTMVKRLREVNIINDNELEELLNETEDAIQKYKIKYSINTLKPNERIAIDNLVELALNAYEKKYITYEKLEYLLGIANLFPENLGICKQNNIYLPSDDELDEIMGEEYD